MTDEEKRQFQEMLRRNEATRRVRQIFETQMERRRREVVHAIYRGMGFEVVVDNSLRRSPCIDVPSKFVEIDDDFYERD